MQNWTLRGDVPPDVSDELKVYPELVRRLLFFRGIKTADEAHQFLNPNYERDLHDPFGILNMEKAVERVLRAIRYNERIVIYGDYDADGIPGSIVLHDFFRKIGYLNFENYIPHRHNEGYGLNLKAVEEFARKSTGLIITVDCGISDIEEVARAQELGVDVLITDHHLPRQRVKAGLPHSLLDGAGGPARLNDASRSGGGDVLPPAYAILNSKQSEDAYAFDMLCGAGVAFKLVQGLIRRGNFSLPSGWEKWLLDVVGISTVADMVPLRGENRALAYFGLKVLRKSERLGVKKLLYKSRVKQGSVTEEDIGFALAPRINAASRLGNPLDAFRLLATSDEAVAEEMAEHVDFLNTKRKTLVATLLREANRRLAERTERDVIVIGDPRWQPGVLGLLAGRLGDTHGRPVFVWGKGPASPTSQGGESDMFKGSCRSPGHISIMELMTLARANTFFDFGGHKNSGGFSVTPENIHTLEESLLQAYAELLPTLGEKEEKQIHIDDILTIEDVTGENFREIERLSPFGIDNPKPVFLFKNIRIAEVKMFGKGQLHLSLGFRKRDGELLRAIGFFMGGKNRTFGAEELILTRDASVDIVATMELSRFERVPEVRLQLVDVRLV